jgi:MFS family permease
MLGLAPIQGALAAVGISQLSMVGIMSLSPISFRVLGASLGAISLALSLHFAGMFACSPAWGVAIDRWGRVPGLLAAASLSIVGAFVATLSPTMLAATFGLFLVGFGWSGAYVGATAIISDETSPVERGKLLGFTDLLSALSGATGALGGGVFMARAGYGGLGVTMAALLLVTSLFVWRRSSAPLATV